MRKLTRSLFLTGVAVGAASYFGFPARLGLTKSQTQVSMPGDLELPTAQIQGDRALIAEVEPAAIWPAALELKETYEKLLGTTLEVVYREAPDLIVWQTASPVRVEEKDMDLFSASIAVALRPAGGATLIQVRERYQVLEPRFGRAAANLALTASAGIVGLKLRSIRRNVADASPSQDN